jgi:hypothetical protein
LLILKSGEPSFDSLTEVQKWTVRATGCDLVDEMLPTPTLATKSPQLERSSERHVGYALPYPSAGSFRRTRPQPSEKFGIREVRGGGLKRARIFQSPFCDNNSQQSDLGFITSLTSSEVRPPSLLGRCLGVRVFWIGFVSFVVPYHTARSRAHFSMASHVARHATDNGSFDTSLRVGTGD